MATRERNLTQRTALRLPPALGDRLDRKARALGLTRSQSVRAALVEWTEDAPPVIEPPDLVTAA